MLPNLGSGLCFSKRKNPEILIGDMASKISWPYIIILIGSYCKAWPGFKQSLFTGDGDRSGVTSSSTSGCSPSLGEAN